MSDETILEEAARITSGDRNKDYGPPEVNHGCTARMVAAYLSRKYDREVEFDAEDVCIFNVLQKISRDANLPKRDNLTDAAGYLRNLEMIRERTA
jgi:hypothetical protein